MQSSSSLQLSVSQQEALSRTLSRHGIPIPSDPMRLADWLVDSEQLTSVRSFVEKLCAESGPNAPTAKEYEQRTVVLGFCNSFDPITSTRAVALEFFLEEFTDDPALITDRRALRTLVQRINRMHEASLNRVHKELDISLQRCNDNMALGRPVVQCLENLLEELIGHRVFCCFNRNDEIGPFFRELWMQAQRFIEAARDGKTYPDETVYPLIEQIFAKLQEMYREESQYWYHEDMIRAYVRDTLIPHAVLNRYIEPNQTTDIYGSIWRFVCDIRSKDTLLVCPSLLFHQPIQPGPRYVGLAELRAELSARELLPSSIPYLEYRLIAKLEERPLEKSRPTWVPFEHPFIRLSQTVDYIPYLLRNLGEPFPRYASTIQAWLPTTFWAIDPAYGIAGRQLRNQLSKLIEPVLNQTLKSPSTEQATTILKSFQSGIGRTMENIVGIIREPIAHFDGNHETPVEPYEVREALVNVALLGLYQPRSDWQEEREVSDAFLGAVKAASRYEIDPDAPINKLDLVDQMEKLVATIQPLSERAMQLSFEPLAIELWIVLCFYTLATINTVRIGRLTDEAISENILVPLNLAAFKEGLAGKARDVLVNVCERICANQQRRGLA
jgi:hypothetical protein